MILHSARKKWVTKLPVITGINSNIGEVVINDIRITDIATNAISLISHIINILHSLPQFTFVRTILTLVNRRDRKSSISDPTFFVIESACAVLPLRCSLFRRLSSRVVRCPVLNRTARFWGDWAGWKFQLQPDCIYTDPDPQFLAPARSLEIGQECPVFSTSRPDNKPPSYLSPVLAPPTQPASNGLMGIGQ